MPTVSVVTAAYNHVRFIRQCVESVQSQTYRDFEHVVVDDGSSDGTTEILQNFGDTINYIRQENRGAHAAINAGIRQSSGEYIAIIDSDDVWLPNKLERQLEVFAQFPDVGLVYSQAYVIDDQGNLLNNGRMIGEPVSDPNQAYYQLLRDNHIPALTAMFKRACLRDVGYFNETLKAMSDWDLWIRIAARWPLGFVPTALALYRDHGKNTWHALLKSGQVRKERLLLLRNASLVAATHADPARSKFIDSIFRELALKTAYGLWYRHQYSEATRYLRFALSLTPGLWKDAILAVRPRLIPRLIAGEWGTRIFKG